MTTEVIYQITQDDFDSLLTAAMVRLSPRRIDPFITISEAARISGRSLHYVRTRIKEGKLVNHAKGDQSCKLRLSDVEKNLIDKSR